MIFAFAQLLTRRCSRGARGDKELMATWKASEALGTKKRKKAGAPNDPLVMTDIAIENDHLQWIFPWKMVMFHSYVNVYQRVQLSRFIKPMKTIVFYIVIVL